ncbi:MAG: hypothetical protein JNK40_13510 [Chromatiales bacterium]|nr:hypothetical protein [Chromatiales bacterium]
MGGSRAIPVALAAAMGATPGAAGAAVFTVQLNEVLYFSNSGAVAGNISSSTATWTYNDVTGLLSQTGGVFNVRLTTAPTSTLFRTSTVGLVMGAGGPASAASYVCTEGNFGANVGASICGNYSFGANFLDESTAAWGPGTAVSRTIGGDDVAFGSPQSIAALDAMTVVNGTAFGTVVLTNRTCAGACGTLPAGSFNAGQQWTFTGVLYPPEWYDPFPFVIPGQTDVPRSTAITSAPIAITFQAPGTSIAVRDGEYSIDGGPFTSAAGYLVNGSSVRVRHISSSALHTAVYTDLTVGGYTTSFSSITEGHAVEDRATTAMDSPVAIDVLANDNDLAATVHVSILFPPAHGTASVIGSPGSPAGISISYVPDPGFAGSDWFWYYLQTGSAGDVGLVRITVISPDADGDDVVDVVDNCAQVANPSQCDSDGDGYGNHCDGDLNNNGATNGQDTTLFRQQLGQPSAGPAYNAADLNCNGAVNAQDTVRFRQLLGKPPGPSGLVL